MTPIDGQVFFNVAAALIGALGGWILKTLWTATENLRVDLNKLNEKISAGMAELERQIPNVYVRRDDFREAIVRMEAFLERIEQKLDRKADR
jgi:hypothetical protein